MSFYQQASARIIGSDWGSLVSQDMSFFRALGDDLKTMRDAFNTQTGVNIPLSHESIASPQPPYSAGTTQLAEEVFNALGKPRPLTTRDKVTIDDNQAAGSTAPALRVNAYQPGVEPGQAVAIDTNGLILQNGVPVGGGGGGVGVVPVGGVIMYDADPVGLDLAVWSVMVAIEDRFVVGAGGAYPLDDVGGSSTHSHTGNTNGHNLALSVNGAISVSGSATTANVAGNINISGNTGNTTLTYTGFTANTSISSIVGSSDTGTNGAHNHSIGTVVSQYAVGALPGPQAVTNTTGDHNHTLAHSHGNHNHVSDHTHAAHNHNFNTTVTFDHNHNVSMTSTGTATLTGNANHVHVISSDTNIPPYFALHYIKRIN